MSGIVFANHLQQCFDRRPCSRNLPPRLSRPLRRWVAGAEPGRITLRDPACPVLLSLELLQPGTEGLSEYTRVVLVQLLEKHLFHFRGTRIRNAIERERPIAPFLIVEVARRPEDTGLYAHP